MTFVLILNEFSPWRYSRAICKNRYHKSGKAPSPGKRAMGQRIETVAMLQGVDRGGLGTRVPKLPEVSPRARGATAIPHQWVIAHQGSPARVWSHLNCPKLGVPNRAYLGGVLFSVAENSRRLLWEYVYRVRANSVPNRRLAAITRGRLLGRTYLESAPFTYAARSRRTACRPDWYGPVVARTDSR